MLLKEALHPARFLGDEVTGSFLVEIEETANSLKKNGWPHSEMRSRAFQIPMLIVRRNEKIN